MGRKRKHVDYRQLYKDHYHIDFGPDMVVHHIDFDRSNNDISNLLLLPKAVHAKYHFAYSMLFGLDKSLNLGDELKLNAPMVPVHYVQWLRNMADVLDEVMPWIRMKCDFDMWPEYIWNQAYNTRKLITKDTVR